MEILKENIFQSKEIHKPNEQKKMLINTNFNIGENVELSHYPLIQGVVVREITMSVSENSEIDFKYYLTSKNLNTLEHIKNKVFDKKDLKKISKDVPQTLVDILTTGITHKEEIATNLVKTINHRKQLEEAEIKLKSMLNLETGETYDSDEITVNCYSKKTIDYTGNQEYDKALSELDNVKEYLKLSKKIVEKETIITTAKIKK